MKKANFANVEKVGKILYWNFVLIENIKCKSKIRIELKRLK